MLTSLLLATVLSGPVQEDAPKVDLRDGYDVQGYRLDIEVFPESKTVQGTVAIEFEVGDAPLETFVCDLWSGNEKNPGLKVESVVLDRWNGIPNNPSVRHPEPIELEFTHTDDQIRCVLPQALTKNSSFPAIKIAYSGTPGRQSGFTGFHWEQTADGSPWIGTSCQGTGAHWWWPCKSSFYNPEDKHEQLFVNATVPKGLYAVSNGKLIGRTVSGEEGKERETFSWHNPYGCETYAVTLNIAPYVVVESELKVEGLEDKVPFIYYVLPENAEKAAVQFTEVPELVSIFSDAFGPYPFPKAKFGLVETSFWGMEHSTAVAYGSSYPLWCEQTGAKDRYASRNRFFDYILVHEVAHEWWGNAVSAANWGHFWIHEGFATYAEAVYLEKRYGRERADEYFAQTRTNPVSKQSLFRGHNKNSGEAYSGLIYSKGALVLNTLRHYVDNDVAWWKSLREFNLSARGGHAETEQFQAILEKNTGREWTQFFEQWFYGTGLPTLTGSVKVAGDKLLIDIDNPNDHGRSFNVPLLIRFDLNEQEANFRIELEPGENKRELALPGEIKNLRLPYLNRIAGHHSIEIDG